ncbi:archease-like [Scenedesmus sp. PABB004]|nr:archease-like [Scenedesmus sp. PABB004]
MSDAEPLVYEPLPQRDAARTKRRRREPPAAAAAAADQAAAAASAVVAAAPAQPAAAQQEPAAAEQLQEQPPGQAGEAEQQPHEQPPLDREPAPEQQQQQELEQDRRQQPEQEQEQLCEPPPAYRSAAVGAHKFEYLDHTADVQLHACERAAGAARARSPPRGRAHSRRARRRVAASHAAARARSAAGGASLGEAFEQVGLALFNYMTPIDALADDPACTRELRACGHDLHSLLYNWLDELLGVYCADYTMLRSITVTALDDAAFTITATGRGERFDRSRHEAGTEVKAITYSAMQVSVSPGDAEVFVIVDI